MNSQIRRDTLTEALDKVQPESIVEVGIMWDTSAENEEGAGHATKLFAEYVAGHPNTSYDGFDINADACNLCRELFKDVPQMHFKHFDACIVHGECDLLYLDGSDDPAEAIKQFLNIQARCVVIDDTWRETSAKWPPHTFYLGKGAGLVPLMEALGWEIHHRYDYMIIAYAPEDTK